MEVSNRFLARHIEKADLNQYWYSPATIDVLVEELLTISKRAAFLSTPSLYFSLPKASDLRKRSALFDLDKQWSREPNFVLYDFNNPEDIPVNIHNTFDCIVIDPPFITEEVWTLYAAAAKLLLAPGGRIVLSTIPENDSFLKLLLGVTPQKFKPSIPHLVYQYHIYTNYSSILLSQPNPEIEADD
ncbi:hypothetical protein ABBQ38_004813 [Trebouxia sp. C0009 RCD-2024]